MSETVQRWVKAILLTNGTPELCLVVDYVASCSALRRSAGGGSNRCRNKR